MAEWGEAHRPTRGGESETERSGRAATALTKLAVEEPTSRSSRCRNEAMVARYTRSNRDLNAPSRRRNIA